MVKSQEIWDYIPGYEGKYKVSTWGRVIKIREGREPLELKQTLKDSGYLSVHLQENSGKYNYYSVHRLVAYAFIPNPYNYSQINHINENKQDNMVENLEWCSASHNINWGTRNNRVAKKLSRPIIAIRIKDGKILEFASLAEARRQGYSPNRISQPINAVRYCGSCKYDEYVWKWKDDPNHSLPIIIDKRKPILAISISNKTIMEFESLRDADRSGYIRNSVKRAIHKESVYKGFVWKFKD